MNILPSARAACVACACNMRSWFAGEFHFVILSALYPIDLMVSHKVRVYYQLRHCPLSCLALVEALYSALQFQPLLVTMSRDYCITLYLGIAILIKLICTT